MEFNLAGSSLNFSYQKGITLSYPDLLIERGSHWLFLGPSGSGKTTLLNMISGLLKPKAGQVLYGDIDLYSMSPSRIDRFRGEHLGIVFQTPRFLSGLSVKENLLCANYFAGKKQDLERMYYLLEGLGMKGSEKARVRDFSQGELQRLSIARALMNNPEILIADEPSSSLDDQNCQEMIDLLESEASEFNTTLLIVSHDARIKSRFHNQIPLG
jgi:putative ABC transport system ATP-binding protein